VIGDLIADRRSIADHPIIRSPIHRVRRIVPFTA